mgnify:CR=1 FL=1
MMRIFELRKWLPILLMLIVTLLTITYAIFRWQIDHMLGGNTQIVDSSQFIGKSGAIAIKNINVLSQDAQSMRYNQTVLINKDKIEFVGQIEDIPLQYEVIDGQGRFLIPGLIDSHVHIKKSHNDLLLYIANGITLVGEMTGMDHHFDIKERINNGDVGPDIFIASPKLNSRSNITAWFRSNFEKRHQSYLTPEQGRQAVRYYKNRGYQAIKLGSHLDADIYEAINEEAKLSDIPVIGHLPVGLRLNDLYRSGQSQLAHIDSITHNLMNEFGGLFASNSKEFLAHIDEHAVNIATQLKLNNITLASTVWLHKTRIQQEVDLPNFLKTIEFEYQNPGWIEGSLVSKGCLPDDNPYETSYSTQEERQAIESFYTTYNEAISVITNALIEKGVPITAGTDSLGACGVIAGFSLHRELETLSQIGFTNAQVLRAATVAPAQWMKIKTGQIKRGYRADLVLLNDNPLEDIKHTKNIAAVIVRGMLFDREQLDNMLAAVKAANASSRAFDISPYIL